MPCSCDVTSCLLRIILINESSKNAASYVEVLRGAAHAGTFQAKEENVIKIYEGKKVLLRSTDSLHYVIRIVLNNINSSCWVLIEAIN